MKLIKKLFSKKKVLTAEEKKDRTAKKVAGLALLGSGSGLYALQQGPLNSVVDKEIQAFKKNPEIAKKLTRLAKKKGVTVYDGIDPSKSVYLPKSSTKNLTDSFKYSKKDNALTEFKKQITQFQVNNIGSPELSEDLAKGKIKGSALVSNSKTPSIVGHELGHHFNHSGSKIKKPLMTIRTHAPTVSSLGSLGMGIKAGLNKDSDPNEATKSGLIIGGLGQIPTLADESIASARSLHLLKRAGASKAQLKAARAGLGTAFGTYAVNAGAGVAANVLHAHLGKAIGKRIRKRLDKKEEGLNSSKN